MRSRPGRLPCAGGRWLEPPEACTAASERRPSVVVANEPRPSVAVQVYFYRDAKVVHQISGIRGEVLPAFSVSDGAVLEANFGAKSYANGIPAGFQGIIKASNLL